MLEVPEEFITTILMVSHNPFKYVLGCGGKHLAIALRKLLWGNAAQNNWLRSLGPTISSKLKKKNKIGDRKIIKKI